MVSPSTLHAAIHRLHVLQIVGNAIVGGMETSVERLVERLPRERFDVTVLCPFESPFTDRLRTLGADVVMATITDEPSWHAIQIAGALVHSTAVDVIQSHLPNAHVLAGIVGSLTGKPVLATIHGRQLSPLDLEVHRLAGSHLAVVCRHSYLHALGCGVAPGRLHLVPNGVDTTAFAPGRPRFGPLRKTFGIADAPVVGFVGRLSWEKGPDVFLRTALTVHATRPDAHFIVVGEGPMRAQLASFIDRYKLAGCTHLLGAQTDMPAVLAETDVIVSSSRSEAMPLAVLEAMAAGLPVVACKVGGVADLVQHGITGWLANGDDHEGLASRVLDLLDCAALRRTAGAAARDRAVNSFDIATSVGATMTLLEQLARPGASIAGTLRRHPSDHRHDNVAAPYPL